MKTKCLWAAPLLVAGLLVGAWLNQSATGQAPAKAEPPITGKAIAVFFKADSTPVFLANPEVRTLSGKAFLRGTMLVGDDRNAPVKWIALDDVWTFDEFESAEALSRIWKVP